MATEAEIQQRIAEAQASIEVPTYKDVAWEGAWKRRAGAIWGVAGVALVVGAITGLLAPLFPILGGMAAAEAIALIPESIAIFSAIGITTGVAIGATMGPSAGAAAATMQEFERRDLARKVEEVIRTNPDMPVEMVQEMVAQKEEDKPQNAKWSDYFRPKTGLLFAAAGALGGLVFAAALSMTGGVEAGMASNFIMPAAKFLLGEAATNTAIMTTYSMGLGALFGANFGVSHPLITRKAVNFANDLLGGKSLGTPWAKTVSPSPQPILSPVVIKPEPAPSMEHPVEGEFCAKCAKATAAKEKPVFKGYEDLVNRSIAEADMAMGR